MLFIHRFLVGSALAFMLPLIGAEFPLPHLAVRHARPLPAWRFQSVPSGKEDEIDWSTPEFAEERADWPERELPDRWDARVNGVGWYRARVDIPADWEGEIDLCLLAAKFTTDLFVNGEYRATVRGGYSPHVLPIRSAGSDASPIEILLRVDNRLSDTTVPKHRVGWQTFGGLDRMAYLLHRPPVRPEDPVLATRRDENGDWRLRVRARTRGRPRSELTLRVRSDSATLATHTLAVEDWSDGVDLEIAVPSPAPWSPASPALHTLELSWGEERMEIPFGFRELEWIGPRLHVNGDPVFLRGFGQHETRLRSEVPLDRDQIRRDLLRMRDVFGANTLRAGHYPNHPDLYHLADEVGLLVFTEIPVWQNRGNHLASDRMWEAWLEPQLDGMVASLRNHPSIFAWGILNETSAPAYVPRAREFVETLDDTRRVAAVLDKTRHSNVSAQTNLLARNLHYGWYHSRSVYALGAAIDHHLRASRGHPLWIAEFGGKARRGRLGGGFSDDVRGTETYLEKMIRHGLQLALLRADNLAGISIWTLTDFRRGNGWEHHGVLDRERRPKLAAYTAATLLRPEEKILALENRRVLAPGQELTLRLGMARAAPGPAGGARRLRWSLRRGARVIAEAEHKAVWTEGTLAVETGEGTWTVPDDAEPGLYYVYAELLNQAGERLHSQAIALDIDGESRPGLLRIAPPPGDAPVEIRVDSMALHAFPHVGLQLALPPGPATVDMNGRTLDVDIPEADTLDLPWR